MRVRRRFDTKTKKWVTAQIDENGKLVDQKHVTIENEVPIKVEPKTTEAEILEPEDFEEHWPEPPEPDVEPVPEMELPFKYDEDAMLTDLYQYLIDTYGEHYKDEKNLSCFDAWLSLGDVSPTFRNTALKYLWRYGKKDGKNKKDLNKALHYILMLMYVDHYKDK